MNGQRIVIGLIVFLLSALCITQTSIMGCSGADPADQQSTGDLSEGFSPFFRDGEGNRNGSSEWRPVSDKVLSQIEKMCLEHGLAVDKLECKKAGIQAVRCVLQARDGLSKAKELLDGLYLMYLTYPNQDTYIVEIAGGGREVEAGWDSLVVLAEAGYSFEVASEAAPSFWSTVFGQAGSESGSEDEPGEMLQTETG